MDAMIKDENGTSAIKGAVFTISGNDVVSKLNYSLTQEGDYEIGYTPLV